jgi:hypothetical protein
MSEAHTPSSPEQSDKLKIFLVKLATDPSELGQFIRDPESSMSRANLSVEDQALLKSGNASAINSRLTSAASKTAAPLLLALVVDVNAVGEPSVREGYYPSSYFTHPPPTFHPPPSFISYPHFPHPPPSFISYPYWEQWRPPPQYPGWR